MEDILNGFVDLPKGYVIGPQPESTLDENFSAEARKFADELGITGADTVVYNQDGDALFRHVNDAKKVANELIKANPARKLQIAEIVL